MNFDFGDMDDRDASGLMLYAACTVAIVLGICGLVFLIWRLAG